MSYMYSTASFPKHWPLVRPLWSFDICLFFILTLGYMYECNRDRCFITRYGCIPVGDPEVAQGVRSSPPPRPRF